MAPQDRAGEEAQWEEAILQRSISLEEIDSDVFCAWKDDLYKPPGARGIFGGQTVCQTLHAAILSAPDEVLVHSLHGYFLLAGDAERNIILHVRRIRDGGSFATRAVEARQKGEAIFTATVQFHRDEPSRGLEIMESMPDVPDPESLRSEVELMEERAGDPELPERMREVIRQRLDGPARFDRKPIPAQAGSELEPMDRYWMRVHGRLSDSPMLHVISLAYMSDAGLLSPALKPFGGIQNVTPDMIASLDHSMWFHSHDFRADDWLLFEVRCSNAAGGRVFSQCKVWTRRGAHVFSCTQEGLIRFKKRISKI